LLLLRALVAAIVVVQAMVFPGWVVKLLVLAGATLLLSGLLTPIVAVVTGLISLAMAFSNFDHVELVVLSGVIALLGPGAFSIDARLFGRREVFIPRRASELPGAPDRSRH
jgi:uncharacterized membrane protein YphA (DoxX/SURF4 family)